MCSRHKKLKQLGKIGNYKSPLLAFEQQSNVYCTIDVLKACLHAIIPIPMQSVKL